MPTFHLFQEVPANDRPGSLGCVRVHACTHTHAHLYPALVRNVKATQLCLTLWNPRDYTVHGIIQARILKWVAIPFSRRSSKPRDWSQVSHIAGGVFTHWVGREAYNPQKPRALFRAVRAAMLWTHMTFRGFPKQHILGLNYKIRRIKAFDKIQHPFMIKKKLSRKQE